jgi:hypothetical protein
VRPDVSGDGLERSGRSWHLGLALEAGRTTGGAFCSA